MAIFKDILSFCLANYISSPINLDVNKAEMRQKGVHYLTTHLFRMPLISNRNTNAGIIWGHSCRQYRETKGGIIIGAIIGEGLGCTRHPKSAFVKVEPNQAKCLIC